MNDLKHTTGLFAVYLNRGGIQGGDIYVTAEDGTIVASVWSGSAREEQEANAILFSAAPDLLAACLRWQANYDQGLGYDYDLQFPQEDVDALRAAIAKATGKAVAP